MSITSLSDLKPTHAVTCTCCGKTTLNVHMCLCDRCLKLVSELRATPRHVVKKLLNRAGIILVNGGELA